MEPTEFIDFVLVLATNLDLVSVRLVILTKLKLVSWAAKKQMYIDMNSIRTMRRFILNGCSSQGSYYEAFRQKEAGSMRIQLIAESPPWNLG